MPTPAVQQHGQADEVRIFAALGDQQRLAILRSLLSNGPSSASALAPSMEVSRQAIDRHLRLLTAVGLLSTQRSGREVLYSPRPETLATTSEWLADLGAEWDKRLALIKALAEA